MALIYLIRHGVTPWNLEKRVCGRTDIPLSEAGREQARLISQRLKPLQFDKIYSSPLKRALEAASIIGKELNIDPVIDERLIEMDYGSWEGKTYSEIIENDFEIFKRWDRDPGKPGPPNGESGNEATQRIIPFLNFLTSHPTKHGIILVSHKTMCRLIVCYVLGLPASEFRRRIAQENAAINIIQPLDAMWRLVLLNDISHLSGFHPERSLVHEDF